MDRTYTNLTCHHRCCYSVCSLWIRKSPISWRYRVSSCNLTNTCITFDIYFLNIFFKIRVSCINYIHFNRFSSNVFITHLNNCIYFSYCFYTICRSNVTSCRIYSISCSSLDRTISTPRYKRFFTFDWLVWVSYISS